MTNTEPLTAMTIEELQANFINSTNEHGPLVCERHAMGVLDGEIHELRLAIHARDNANIYEEMVDIANTCIRWMQEMELRGLVSKLETYEIQAPSSLPDTSFKIPMPECKPPKSDAAKGWACVECGKNIPFGEQHFMGDDGGSRCLPPCCGGELIEVPDNSHYTKGGIEPWDYIVANNMNYLEGNVIKYVSRWRYKNGLDDLRKARVYIDKLIHHEENKA